MTAAVKYSAIALGALAVTGAGVLPWYSSRAMEQRLSEMAQKSSPHEDVMLRNLQHHAGYLSSKGSVDVVLRDRCQTEGASSDTTFHVEYEANHFPTPTAANHFDWRLQPTGDTAPVFKKLFGSDTALSGQGKVTWAGLISSDLKLPAMAYATPSGRLEADPSQGRIAVGGKALQFDWQMERAVLRGSGHALELKQLGVNLDLSNRQKGIGEAAFRMGAMSTAEASAEGYVLKSVTSERGDKLDSVVSQTLARVQFGDQEIKDVALEAAIKGLHAQSVETLTTVLGASCGMETLTRDESAKVRQAVQTLLASGLNGGITKLSGKGKQGAIDGKLTLDLAAVGAGQAISFARQLSSSGELTVQGDMLPPMPRQMALNSGFAREVANGLQSSFVFEKGLFKVNGKTFDATGVQNALAAMDVAVMAYINDERPTRMARQEAPAPAPEAEEIEEVAEAEVAPPAPAQAPAPVVAQAMQAQPAAPAVAPAAPQATCTDARSCTRASLQAAWREDLDGVRQLAAQIDALPKPPLGNKAQARKLNTQALDALQKGDATAAVALLQSALQENPRDVEIASNLGFALLKDQRAKEAVAVLSDALVLDPRRTSTWAPLGEALSQSGQPAEASAALWTAWQWSGNRERTLTAYQDKADREASQRPSVAEVFRASASWVARGEHPSFRPSR